MTTEYAAYNSTVASYNTLKDAYTKAYNDEFERAGDYLRVIFEDPIPVPTRPCPPDQPIDYWGLKIDLGNIVPFTSWTTT